MESVLTENSNNNLETTYVKEVYEEIAPHFSNTRSYKWSWVIDFLDSWARVLCGLWHPMASKSARVLSLIYHLLVESKLGSFNLEGLA